MNKGLEIIEAHWLFNMPYEQIERRRPAGKYHPLDGRVPRRLDQSATRRADNAGADPVRADLAAARPGGPWGRVDWLTLGSIHFEPPDFERFPCLRLAQEAGRRGGTFPTVLAAADEEAVAGFLAGRWRFGAIACLIELTLAAHEPRRLRAPRPGRDSVPPTPGRAGT